MIELVDICLRYYHNKSEIVALEGLHLSVQEEEFVCILGPSGSGKSSLLHLIAGFIKASHGQVLFNRQPVTGPDASRGVVFQKFSLFPWETVGGNVAFGLARKKVPKDKRQLITEYYLQEVGLLDFQHSYPLDLSVGMQQRVAIARAFANDPKVLLMDEPFASLDAQTTLRMRELLLRIWEKEKKTVVFVTHDIEEALMLADRIIILSNRPGKVVHTLPVNLERPRALTTMLTNEYLALKKTIYEYFFAP